MMKTILKRLICITLITTAFSSSTFAMERLQGLSPVQKIGAVVAVTASTGLAAGAAPAVAVGAVSASFLYWLGGKVGMCSNPTNQLTEIALRITNLIARIESLEQANAAKNRKAILALITDLKKIRTELEDNFYNWSNEQIKALLATPKFVSYCDQN